MTPASVFHPRMITVAMAVVLAFLLLMVEGATAREAEPSADQVLGAVVGIRATVPADARTAETLGAEREGNGVVIDEDGLVLTIGYLILEATDAGIVLADGTHIPATIVGYDHNTGFGLLRAREALPVTPMPLGDSESLQQGEQALVVSLEGPRPVTPVRIASRRPFAGYWEYLLDSAIFTVPPHPNFGGAALVGSDGRLLGIGSLMVNDAAIREIPVPGNMFVPVELLKPIMGDLLTHGRVQHAARPWLGMQTRELNGILFVMRVTDDGPAASAGVKPGDAIIGVGGDRIADMVDFFRKVWAVGDAGVDIPLDLVSGAGEELDVRRVNVKSGNRYDWLRMGGN